MNIQVQGSRGIANESLQIGDIAYSVSNTFTQNNITASTDEPIEIGIITDIDREAGVIVVGSTSHTPAMDDFLMFLKNVQVNNTSLLGHYAEVKLTNNSVEEAELFAVSSEVVPSSK